MSQHQRPAQLTTEKVSSDRKLLFLDLLENARGRFVKITEDVGGRRHVIMIPVQALPEFLDALRRLKDWA